MHAAPLATTCAAAIRTREATPDVRKATALVSQTE